MNNLRLSGLASGMDTDAMVQSMMKAERMKVDRVVQNKQVAMWRQESYNNMNKSFANFILNSKKDMGLSNSSSTGSISHSNYTKLDYLRKASSSNESAATVSSTNKTINGSYTIDVKEMAKGASFTSVKISDDAEVLKDGMTFTLSNGKIKETNSAEIVVKVSGKKVTMEDVVKAINGKKGETGITAFTNDGRLFLQTTETGKGQSIKLSAVGKEEDRTDAEKAGANFIGEGGLGYIDVTEDSKENSMPGGTEEENKAVYKSAQQAQIEYNGVKLNYASNNIEFNGLNIQLKSEGVTTINVDTNVDGIMEKVEKLIEDYNKLVDQASKAVGEKRYSGYRPLSQEEKKAMHEDDVKLWQEKARSGMLNRDETVNRVMQNMRNEIYRTVDTNGKFNHITQIGISTEKYSKGSAGGKLVIDTEKLRKKILEDPEGVMELLFTENEDPIKREDTDKKLKKYDSTQGVFTRVYDSLIDGMKSIVDKSGPGENSDLLRSVRSNLLIDFVTKKSSISDLDKQVFDMNKKIDSLNIMLDRKEDAHYAKFTAMEKYMHQMNSQSSWLMQQQ